MTPIATNHVATEADERERGTAGHRPPEPAVRADEARGERGEDEHGLEPLAEDEQRAVDDDRAVAEPDARRGRVGHAAGRGDGLPRERADRERARRASTRSGAGAAAGAQAPPLSGSAPPCKADLTEPCFGVRLRIRGGGLAGGSPRRRPYDRRGDEGEDLRGLMRLWPHGVSVLSVDVDGDRMGVTVSSLVSLSLEPPLVGVSIGKQASCYELLRQAGRFAISLLGSGQEDLARRFASGWPPIVHWQGVPTREGLDRAADRGGARLDRGGDARGARRRRPHVLHRGRALGAAGAVDHALVYRDRAYHAV